jgi:hypothetical protein
VVRAVDLQEEAVEVDAEVRVVEVGAVAVFHDPAEVLAVVDQQPANGTT